MFQWMISALHIRHSSVDVVGYRNRDDAKLRGKCVGGMWERVGGGTRRMNMIKLKKFLLAHHGPHGTNSKWDIMFENKTWLKIVNSVS